MSRKPPGYIPVDGDELADKNYVDRRLLFVTDLGAVGDGTTDDTAAIQAAIAAAPEGTRVVLDQGKTFRVTDTLYNRDSALNRKSVQIDATGATLLIDHAATTAGINFSAPWLDQRTVTGMTANDNIPVPSYASDNSRVYRGWTITLSVAPPATWKRGDVLRLTADDVIPGSRDAGKPSTPNQGRVGDFVTLVSISGSSVVVAGAIIDPYTTGRLLAKMDSGINLTWRGGRIKYSDTAFNNTPRYTFSIAEAYAPIVENVRIDRTNRGGFFIRECYGWTMTNCDVMYGVNDTTTSAYGYGVLNIASAYGTVQGCRWGQVRHGYTNGHGMIAAGTGLVSNHGRPYGNRIIGCVGESCTSSAFDSHTSGAREQFIGCEVHNAPIGVGLRGRDHLVSDLTVTDTDIALFIFDEGYGGQSWGHQVDGVNAKRVKDVVLASYGVDSAQSAYLVREERPTTIRNVHAVDVSESAIRGTYCTMHLSDWFVAYATSGVASRTTLMSRGCKLYINNMTLDYTPVAITGFSLFSNDGTASAVSVLEIDRVRVIGNKPNTFLYLVSGGGTAHVVRVSNVVLDNGPSSSAGQSAFVAGMIGWTTPPGMPVFSAEKPNSFTLAVSGWNAINSWTELVDVGDWFNPVTGKGVIPETGLYLLTASIVFSSSTTGRRFLQIDLGEGAAGSNGIGLVRQEVSPVGSGYLGLCVTRDMVPLNKGDTIQLAIYQTSGGSLGSSLVTFTCRKVM